MKILYLHQYFNTPTMSGGTRSYEMARRFVTAGHEVHVITSAREACPASTGWTEETIDGVHVHWLPVPYSNAMSFGRRIVGFVNFAIASCIKAKRVGGDIVFATSTPLTIAIPGVFASKVLSVPMVFEVRDLWPELPIAIGVLRNPLAKTLARWLERFAYRHSAAVVALSPGMAEGVSRAGYPRDKISVIPNSADNLLFRVKPEIGHAFLDDYPYLKGGHLIVYTGALGLINGVAYLVDIAQHCRAINPATKFLIVGDGAEFDSIESQAKSLYLLGESLWIIRSLPKQEMHRVLSAATVCTSLFVDLPEMHANSANKFFDALAAGKPIMINYGGWQADILEETGAGIVVPPDDARKAAEMLHDFLQDEERLKQASRAAAELADTRFSRDKLAGELLEVLETAVAETKR